MLHILSEHTCLILHAYVIWMKLQFRFNWSVTPGNYYCCAQDVRSELFNGKAHIFFSIIFLNLLDSMSNWWPISNLSKLLQPALTMQFRIALNEAGSWQWMHLSLTLIVLNLIHSLAFISISCCQCVCQTLLNVKIDAPISVPYFPVPPAHAGEGGLSEPPCTASPLCAGLPCCDGAALELGNGKVVCNGNY